jgi:hypothetical protein
MNTNEEDHSSNSDGISNRDQLPGGDGAFTAEGPPLPDDLEARSTEQTCAQAAEALLPGATVRTARELAEEEFEPLQPLVTFEGRPVLHEGMSLLAAKPKMGKSMLAMNISVAVATGGVALGHGEARQGRVLYLDLDGCERDMQERLHAMCDRDPAPTQFHAVHPAGQFPTGEEAVEHLEMLTGRYDLIILDTVNRVRPTTDGRRNAYHADYDFLHPLAQMGREHGTSILAIHHLNKNQRSDPLDKVSGSTGMTAAVETVMVLDGERGKGEAELKIHSRRGDEHHDLEFDDTLLTWKLGGIPEPGTDARKEVWDALKDADGWTRLGDLQDVLGTQKNTISEHLKKLKQKDDMPVKRDEQGRYRAA